MFVRFRTLHSIEQKKGISLIEPDLINSGLGCSIFLFGFINEATVLLAEKYLTGKNKGVALKAGKVEEVFLCWATTCLFSPNSRRKNIVKYVNGILI